MHDLTLKQVFEGLKAKEFSSVELTKHMLDRIGRVDKEVNAYITVNTDEALEQAEQADQRGFDDADLSPLHGVPMGIKDLINTKGLRTTCASNFLKDFVPPYDATVVRKLRDAGMVLLGKLNLDEFACGSSTEHSAFGVTKNPWNLECVAGGSSGGSAAAVAADLAFYTLGTDTGGSIRLPASFCGVVGLKVTYGRVSRSGVTAMASSWDTIGPMGKTVEDVALVLNTIAGADPKDSTTPPVDVPDYTKNLGKDIKGLRIGLPEEYFGEGIDPEVRSALEIAIKQLEQLGAKVKSVSLPFTKYAIALYYVIVPAELSANLARFDGLRYGSHSKKPAEDLIAEYYNSRSEGFNDEVKRRIVMGTYVLSAGYYDAYYTKAQKVRTLVMRDFENVFQDVDLLASPVAPGPAFPIGSKVNDPLAMYLTDAFSIPASCAGIPGLSVPCGFTSKGLPIGIQLMAPQFQEDLLLRVGAAYEQSTEWHKRKTPIT